MKKIKILLVLTVFLSLVTISCDDFGDINTDPNNSTVVPAHLLLGNIIRVNQNSIYGMQQGGDMGMCWAQHVSKVQYNDEERYIPRRGAIDVVWDNLYTGVIADAKAMYSLAKNEGNTNLMAISLILQANAFQILTDLYGPVGFSEANQKGNIKPKYDSQEQVYDGLIAMLSEAQTLFTSGTGTVVASSDLLYGGDIQKWSRFCNSLKFKALMRITKKRNVSALLQNLVNTNNLMSNNSDSAQLIYKAAQPDANPIYETVVFSSRPEYKLSSVLVSKMQSTNDTRLTKYGQPTPANIYVGNVPGVENPTNFNGFSSLGTLYLSPTLPGVILSNSQLQFLLAEAANEGYITGGLAAALSYYNKGIEASFEFNGIQSSAAAFYSQANITFTNQSDARVKIGEQNWTALFGQGFEAWTEWRRTGYPALSPVVNAAPGVPTIPSRLFYQQFESSLNNANYTAAVSTLSGGDKLTSKVWWMN